MLQNSRRLISKKAKGAVEEKQVMKKTRLKEGALNKLAQEQAAFRERLLSIPIKNSAAAERVLKIVFSRTEQAYKTADKINDPRFRAVWERVARVWQKKAIQIEQNFLELNERELTALRTRLRTELDALDLNLEDREGRARILTTEFEEQVLKRAKELNKRAYQAGEGTALGSALFRAYAPWLSAASSAGRHTRGPMRVPQVKKK